MDLYLRTKKDNNNEYHAGKPDMFWGQGENDLVVDTNGDFALTQGLDCLNQSMAKIIVTARGANVFYPMYGSTLNDLIGVNLDIDFLRAKIKTDLIDTLRIYQFINKGNPNADEQIDTLQALKITQIVDGVGVSLRVLTRSGKTTGSLVQIEG